jgi:hypothetical protein
MTSNFKSFRAKKMVPLFSALLFLSLSIASTAAAQLAPAPTPGANLGDARFKGVTEDWTTPALTGSHLTPAQPVSIVNNFDGYTLELTQVQWRWADPIDLYILKPKGAKNPPVILYLFSYNSETDVFKDPVFGKNATKDGFAAVGFVSALTGHRYHDRAVTQWFISELQECLATSTHDVQMVLNYLTDRGDLDMSRVGMFGQGSGASIAIMASAVDPRIKVLDVLDPWGDWPVWLAQSPFVPENERAAYVTPEFLKKAATLEPVDWLPKIQAKKFRFQDAIFEPKTPKSAKEKLRAAAPAGTKFVLYQNEKEFDAVFQNSVNTDWMEHELRMLAGTTDHPPAHPAPTSVSNNTFNK